MFLAAIVFNQPRISMHVSANVQSPSLRRCVKISHIIHVPVQEQSTRVVVSAGLRQMASPFRRNTDLTLKSDINLVEEFHWASIWVGGPEFSLRLTAER